eukprot:jgi/Mesvir1/24177/Mv10894-RA.1
MVLKRAINSLIALNCPVSQDFPGAGITRPTFRWTDASGSFRAYFTGVYDATTIAGNVSLAVPANCTRPTEYDYKAMDLLGRIVSGRYTPPELTIVESAAQPYSGGRQLPLLVVTGSPSNGPVPLDALRDADPTMSSFLTREVGDGGSGALTEYHYAPPVA